jgi:uncharacterized membrane protein
MFTAFNVALFGHILGILLFFSGIAVAGVPFEAARRRTDPSEIAIILGIAHRGIPIAAAGMLLLLACGFWLVHLGRWSLGTGWVAFSLALFVAASVLGAVAGQRPKAARLHADRLAASRAPMDAQLRELLDDRASRAMNYASALALLAILGLMVFKP